MNSMLRQHHLRMPDIKPFLRSFERHQPISQDDWAARESKLFTPGCLIFCLEPVAAPSGLSSFSKKGGEDTGETYRVKDLCLVVSTDDGQPMVVNITASAFEFRTLDSLMVEKARKSILDGRDFNYVSARPTVKLDRNQEKALYELASKYAQGGSRRSLTVDGSPLAEPVFALLAQLGANLATINPQSAKTVIDIGSICHMIITPEGRQEDKTKSLLRTSFNSIKAADLEQLANPNKSGATAAAEGLYNVDPAAVFFGEGADLGALASSAPPAPVFQFESDSAVSAEPVAAPVEPVRQAPPPPPLPMQPPAPFAPEPQAVQPEPMPPSPSLEAMPVAPTASFGNLTALPPAPPAPPKAEKMVAPEWFKLSHDLVPVSALGTASTASSASLTAASTLKEALAAPFEPEPKVDFASQFLSDYQAGHAGSSAIEYAEEQIQKERALQEQEEKIKQQKLKEYFGEEHYNTYISESKGPSAPPSPASLDAWDLKADEYITKPMSDPSDIATFDSEIFNEAARSTLEINPEAKPELIKALDAKVDLPPPAPDSWISYADQTVNQAISAKPGLQAGSQPQESALPQGDIETVAP
ncbi:MAG TPA: hypothetical protein PL112_07905, partial [Candidatus Obscuribacter sp.]|nr:hypothetical protein [Candidatus Obscuribacter sp.]